MGTEVVFTGDAAGVSLSKIMSLGMDRSLGRSHSAGDSQACVVMKLAWTGEGEREAEAAIPVNQLAPR